MRSMLALATMVLVPTLAGCTGTGRAGAMAPEYTLVLLKTGPRTDLSTEAKQKVFQGHMANMQRLFDEGPLLVAGPFGAQKSDAALRGVFVFDTADLAQARAWAETDPGFREGVFRFEFHALATTADLRGQRRADLAAQAAATAAGKKLEPADTIRGYATLTAADGDAARAALAGHAVVVLDAGLDGNRAWFVLDAASAADAKAKLGTVLDRIGTHTLDDWYASKLLVELPQRRPQ
jgi:uncharacterized protein YciI